jgi:hypothetical protein
MIVKSVTLLLMARQERACCCLKQRRKSQTNRSDLCEEINYLRHQIFKIPLFV